MRHFARIPHTFLTANALATALVLAGCGGGADTTLSAATPAAATTKLQGAVVKGPVDGAKVCAYTVAGKARGTQVGNCVNTDASGNYNLTVPASTGPVWLEATGGSYIDETTQQTTLLSTSLTTLASTLAGSAPVDAMLTPLTTLALRSTITQTTGSAPLDVAAFTTASIQLLADLGLTGFDPTTSAPKFGTDINAYGRALTAVSQLVANGTPLADFLSTAISTATAQAYKDALAKVSGTTPAVPSGGTVALTLSAVKDVGAVDTSAFDMANNTLIGAYEYDGGAFGKFLTVTVNSNVAGSTDANRSRRMVVQFYTLTPTVGKSYPAFVGDGSVAQIDRAGSQFYQFEDNAVPSPKGRLYNGSGGTVTVVARSDSSITVRLDKVEVIPGLYIAGLPTTGSFTVSGEITAPIIKQSPTRPAAPVTPTAAVPLVITLATTASWNGTVSTTTAQYEHGSSDETATAFQPTQAYCRVAAYSLVAADGKKYYLEIPFRKDNKAIGLLKFGDDASLETLARVLNPSSGVSIDIANRRITFSNLLIGTSAQGLTLNGTLDYPTNIAPENRANCG